MGVLLAGIGLASCSSNTSRFDYPMFASSNTDNTALTTASVNPVPEEPVYQAAPDQTVVKTELPPPAPAANPYPAQQRVAAVPQPAPAPMPLPQRAPPPPKPENLTVTVKKGDSLSKIASRHDVSVKQIMSANNLPNTRLSIGQKLVIPGRHAAPAPAPARVASRASTYTVRSGDSLSIIADKHDIAYQDLARHNKLSRNAVLQPGQVLKIPAGASGPAKTPVRVASRSSDIPVPQANPARSSQPAAAAKPRKKAPTRKAALPQPKPMTGNRFRWPVRGRVISGFGPKPNGKHNDGINVAVPLGASVKSAENGVVAYAGSELEGYGNLILIRHANNWVSAYAHNDEILVKRGDEVRRGQIIAKSGKTGTVSQPQVHFELRKGSQPVDPLKYMSSS